MLLKKKTALLIVFFVLALLLAAFKFLHDFDTYFYQPRPDRRAAGAEVYLQKMQEVLFSYGARIEWITGNDSAKIVRLPEDMLLIEPYVELSAAFQDLGGELLRAESTPSGNKMVLEVGHNGASILRVTLLADNKLKRVAGKIAIVIDDFGYSFGTTAKEFLSLPQPVTYSILPGLEYSKEIARSAHDKGREVMVHMPMEPQNGNHTSDDFILLTGMGAKEIRARLRKAIADIPHARGMNNHQGSLASLDEKLLNTVFDEIHRVGFYFLDSQTNNATNAYPLAKKKRIPSALNNTFLDNVKEKKAIDAKLTRIAELATSEGFAIAIGHPYEETLESLQEKLPELEKRGFKFVGVSEVVH